MNVSFAVPSFPLERAPPPLHAWRVVMPLHVQDASGQASNAAPARGELESWIVAVAATADRACFAKLYERFAPRVRGYLTKLGTAPNIAEELAQETMISLWRKAASFDPARSSASTWIFTIARNLRIDHFRRTSRQQDGAGDPTEEHAAPAQPDTCMMAVQDSERVKSALANLSSEQAEIIKLYYFSEMPHSEIAESLHLPLGTVKSRVRLAIARLRSLLDDLK